VQLLHERKEELLPNTSVSEAHAFPLRPPSFEEPHFPTAESRRTVVEHLRKAQWLSRASELRSNTGETAHAPEEPVELGRRCGCIELIRGQGRRRCSWRRRRVLKVLDRWREVCNWWDEERKIETGSSAGSSSLGVLLSIWPGRDLVVVACRGG
jgi:hypothetical protein